MDPDKILQAYIGRTQTSRVKILILVLLLLSKELFC